MISLPGHRAELRQAHADGRRTHWVPSPDEIRRACVRIQAEWSDTERLRRAGVNPFRSSARVARVSPDCGFARSALHSGDGDE
jgi:hypothetical protein